MDSHDQQPMSLSQPKMGSSCGCQKSYESQQEDLSLDSEVTASNDNSQESLVIFGSGRSRISCREGHEPIRGGMDPQCRCFLAKMYAKTKELGPPMYLVMLVKH